MELKFKKINYPWRKTIFVPLITQLQYSFTINHERFYNIQRIDTFH